MSGNHPSPAFGTADLTNCDRELIQLPGSVQPHGVLLILHPEHLRVLQASSNAEAILGTWGASPLGKTIDSLDPELGLLIRRLRHSDELAGIVPAVARVETEHGVRTLEAMLHRLPREGIAVELEPVAPDPAGRSAAEVARQVSQLLTDGIAAISVAPSHTALYGEVVRVMRAICGYDRVMVYKFDPEGHGEIVGEARLDDLEPYLGLHYPASDIPHQARELYLRNRVRVLVDVSYQPAQLFPRLSPITGSEVDMSMSSLRSMSPLHLQYLSNMGVRATLVTSLAIGDRLWGLIACHHYAPRWLPYEVRAAAGILSEMVAARLAALDSVAATETEHIVRTLEDQVVDSLATTGDWRNALFASPHLLLQTVRATGAALVHDGALITAGEVPSSDGIRAVVRWLEEQHPGEPVVRSDAMSRSEPALRQLAGPAAGVMAIALSARSRDYLLWFRPEQHQTIRWAGDPRKPVDPNDPKQLSPRRSFAVWTEVTRGSCRPWTEAEEATARAIRSSLVDMVQQVQAVRVLIAQEQFSRMMQVVQLASEPTLIMSRAGQVVLVNEAFRALLGPMPTDLTSAEDLSRLLGDDAAVNAMLTAVRAEQRPWAGELLLTTPDGERVPLAVRADPVPGDDGLELGCIIFASDERPRRKAEAAQQRVQDSLLEAHRRSTRSSPPDADTARGFGAMMDAILSTARRSFTDISGEPGTHPLPSALASVEDITRRAAAMALHLEGYTAARRKRQAVVVKDPAAGPSGQRG